jgi:hypothetical protein
LGYLAKTLLKNKKQTTTKENHNEISSHPSSNGYHQKDEK